MFGALSQKITTLVVSLGSLFNSNLSPNFIDVNVRITNTDIFCSACLTECIDKELVEIFHSGETIILNIRLQTFASSEQELVEDKTITHRFTYEMVDEYYEVFCSEEGELVTIEDFKEAKNKFVTFDEMVALKTATLDYGEKYYIKLTATIAPIFLDSTHRNIDLMKYWNNKSPQYITEEFEKPTL